MSHAHFPKHWATAPLEEITEFVTSGSRGWGDYYSESGPLFLRVGNLDHDTVRIDLSDSVHVQPPNGSEGLRTRVEEGDILISITAEVGMVGLVRSGLGEAYVNQHVALVRPLPSVYSEGLAYSLLDPQGLQAVARREQYGATKPGLSLIQVRGFEIPIPPLPEQQRIVEAIESYFTRLDDAVATLQRVKRNLKRYRASVLKSAVEGRLVPTEAALAKQEGRTYEPASLLLERILNKRRRLWSESGKTGKYKEPAPPNTTNLPELPEGWCWATVESLSTKVADGVHKKPNYVESGIPFVTVRNLTAGPGISFENLKYVTREDHEDFLRRTNPEAGDLLVSKDGTLGVVRAIRTDREFSIFVSVALVKPVEREMTDYLELALSAPTVQAQMVPKGSGLQHIHLEDLRQDCIPLAPTAEQRRIVLAVQERLSITDALEMTTALSLGRTTRLRQSILKWAFEGRLAAQDSEDEPAAAVLERIKAERETKTFTKAPPTKRPQRGAKKKQVRA